MRDKLTAFADRTVGRLTVTQRTALAIVLVGLIIADATYLVANPHSVLGWLL